MLRYYWDKKRIVFWCTGIFLLIGLFFAFFSQAEYQTGASIIPEYDLQDEVNRVIESYGLIFGLTGSIGERQSPADLLERYPYMIRTTSFKKKLMYEPFYYPGADSAITMYTYFTRIYQPSLTHTLYNYTFGLISDIGSEEEYGSNTQLRSEITQQDTSLQIIRLSSTEAEVISQLNSRIIATYRRRPGIVHIQTTMPDPLLAAKLAKITLQVLQETASDYKTKKGRIYKNFLQGQLEQAETELMEARDELITFKQAESQPLNQRMELQSRYNSSLDYYNTLSQQFERIKLTIREQLPAFRVLDAISIPDQRSAPNRKLIIIFSLLLGFFVAICWITALFFGNTLRGKTP